MRSWLTCVCVLTVVACYSAQQRQNQPSIYHVNVDNFNTDSIIQNERVLNSYLKCFMDRGPCTKNGKNLKILIPETLTACARCSTKEKEEVRKLLVGIRNKSEPGFFALLEKYDPQRTSRDALYNFLATGN